jgi:hypothetical protein
MLQIRETGLEDCIVSQCRIYMEYVRDTRGNPRLGDYTNIPDYYTLTPDSSAGEGVGWLGAAAPPPGE